MRTLTPELQPVAPEARRVPSRAQALALSPRLEALLALGLVLLYLAVQVPTLTRFPPLNNDEGREANLSWVASGLQPGSERMNAYRNNSGWGTGGLQGATTVVVFKLFSLVPWQPSLVFQARLVSLIWAGLLLLVVYWLGRYYWGRSVGLAATVLLAVSDPFLLASHTHRPDVQVAGLVLLALALVEHGLDSGRDWPPLLAGLLLGLSFDTHPNTLGFVPLVLAAPLLRHGWGVWRARSVHLLAAGLGIAALYYVAVRVLPDPSGYLTALRYWIGVDKAPPLVRPSGGGGLVAQLQLEALRYADYFGISAEGIEEAPELVLVLFGLTFALWRAARGSRPDRLFLLGLTAAAIFFVAAVSMKSRYYMLLSYPIYTLLIARGFQQVVAPLAERLRSPLVAQGVIAALVLVSVLWPLKFYDRAWDKYIRAHRYRAGQEYFLLTSQLDQLAGPNARILAPPLYWFGLREHPYSDIFVYERVKKQFGQTPAEFLDAVQPDFVVTDAKIATDKATERELHRALLERAPAQLVVRHKNYGDVVVYRLRHD